MDREELRELRRRLSPILLPLPGVAGVGSARGRLVVYLEAPGREVEERVRRVLAAEAPGIEPEFVVSGPFRRGAGR